MTDDGFELLRTEVVARICPVCLEQVEPECDGDDDYHCHYGTSIQPLEVTAYPYIAELRSKRDLALFQLQTDIRDHEFAKGERRWYGNLSVADRFWEDSRRKAAERRRLEALSPRVRRFEEMLTRQLYSDAPLLGWFSKLQPRADDLDNWFSEDDRIPEVEEALGLS